MDNIIELIQQQAPYLLPYIIGMDYLKPQGIGGFPIPVLILDVNNNKIVVPVINGEKLLAFYVPSEDKFYPLTPEWFQYVTAKLSGQFNATQPEGNVIDDFDLYNMVRPPMSGRTVWASAVEVADDLSAGPEYFEYGLVVVVKKEGLTPPAKAYIIQNDEQFKTPELGKPMYFLTREGTLTAGVLLKSYTSDNYYALITEQGTYLEIPKQAKLPIGIELNIPPKLFVPPEQDGDLFGVLVGDSELIYPIDERIPAFVFGATEVVRSDFVKSPLWVGSQKLVLPTSNKYKLVKFPQPVYDAQLDRTPAIDLVTEPSVALKMLAQHYICYQGADTYLLDGKLLDKKAAAQELVNMGLGPQDVYQLLQQNQANFAVIELEDALARNTASPTERLEELLEAFDSQVRHLLKTYLDGNLAPEATEIVENLYAALANYKGS
jgi:hypothetical protein